MESQFLRLADIFHTWAGYASVKDMVGCGLALFPPIPRAYARALAISLKRRYTASRDAATHTDQVTTANAATDALPLTEEALGEQYRVTTTPSKLRP